MKINTKIGLIAVITVILAAVSAIFIKMPFGAIIACIISIIGGFYIRFILNKLKQNNMVFNKIIWQESAPKNKSDIWFDGKNWKINDKGTWKSAIQKSDWSENNVESQAYIENRPFYKEMVTTTISKEDLHQTGAPIPLLPTSLKVYDVDTINGVKVTLPINNYPQNVETVKVELDKDNVLDFGIYSGVLYYRSPSHKPTVDLTITYVSNIHKIPEYYIPDSIVRHASYTSLENRVSALEARIQQLENN